jgi:hypothetical protein
VAHDSLLPTADDPKPLALSWSDEFYSIPQQRLPDDTHQHPVNLPPPVAWQSYTQSWPQLHYNYPQSTSYQEHTTQPAFPHLNLLSVPTYCNSSDIPSVPTSSTSYSSSPLSYATAPPSPFSFPPSPIPLDSTRGQPAETLSHRYVHPSDLTAPMIDTANTPAPAPASAPALPMAQWTSSSTSAAHTSQPFPYTKQSTDPISRSKAHLPAPATRSRIRNTNTESVGRSSDTPTNGRGPKNSLHVPRKPTAAHRGGKRKRTAYGSIVGRRPRAAATRQSNAAHTSNGYGGDHDQGSDYDREDGLDDSIDDDNEDDNDGSYSTSSSSYSPSSSPGPSSPVKSDTTGKTRHAQAKARARYTLNGPLPLPIPVPNLIKKSRGRKVPSIMAGSEDAHDGNGDLDGANSRARSYMCPVPGCGKCFIRGEHLKRHVRSIHTYDKRE